MLHARPSTRSRAPLGGARRLLILPLLAALTACGGGGGGGAAGAGSRPFTITLDRSVLEWSHYEGSAPTPQTINSNSTGTYNGNLYVQITIENSGTVNAIDPAIPITVNGTAASAR